MLKKRLLTAFALIVLTVGIIFFSPPRVFQLAVALLLVAAAWEWMHLAGIKNLFLCLAYSLLIVILFTLAPLAIIMYILFFSVLCWLLILQAIVYYPANVHLWCNKIGLSLLGIAVFIPFATTLVWLKASPLGASLLLYLLLLVWTADTGAYVVGKLWGKHKLVVKVSPGKTIEGACGGMVLSCVISMIYGIFVIAVPGVSWVIWLSLGVVTVVVSILGDLLISMIKRQAGVKNSGRVLPGHGGVLDRIDSLIAASPIFMLIYLTAVAA
ncbi:MAG: phosphatidate cytidylyltransferase [Gammaproteobacteria bacterium]